MHFFVSLAQCQWSNRPPLVDKDAQGARGEQMFNAMAMIFFLNFNTPVDGADRARVSDPDIRVVSPETYECTGEYQCTDDGDEVICVCPAAPK
jgi:hypothetical protein